LIYSETQSPLAQPRNLFLGHLLSAFVGVTIYKLFGENLWFSAALSVALSIVLMRAAKAQHPPGGATALIANIGGTQIHDLGYAYLWQPVFCSLVILFIFALVINNLIDFGSYPTNFEVQWQKVKSYLSK
jgi:CBS-domain-containing membrane protein